MLKGECSNPLSAQIPSDQWIHSTRTVKNSSNNVNSDNDSLLVPDDDLPASSASNLSMASTPAQSPSPSPSPTLSDHPSDNEDDRDDPFRDLVGIENPIDDFFGILDENQETHSEIMDLPGPTPLVHQSPADATVENRTRVASSPSLNVGPVAAAESNVAPSMLSPARTRPKRRITIRKMADQGSDDDEGCGNSDCEDSSRPGEMVKCAGPSCCTQVRNQKPSRSLPQG